MDELKREMEKELEASKSNFEEARIQELETVKDVSLFNCNYACFTLN